MCFVSSHVEKPHWFLLWLERFDGGLFCLVPLLPICFSGLNKTLGSLVVGVLEAQVFAKAWHSAWIPDWAQSQIQVCNLCLQCLMDGLGCRAMLSWQRRHGSVPCPYKQGWSHPLNLWEYGDTNKLTAFKLPDGHGNGSKAGNTGKHYIQLSQNKILQLFLSLETFCFYSIAFNDAKKKKKPFLFQTIQCFPHLHFFQRIDVNRITAKSPNRRCPCSLVLETAMKYWNVLKGLK